MEDYRKTKRQLIDELESLRKRLAEEVAHRYDQEFQEKLLRAREEGYRTVIETMPIPYAEQNLAGYTIYSNNAYLKESGYDLEELKKIGYKSSMGPADAVRAYQFYHNVYKTGIPQTCTNLANITKSGEKKQYDVSVSLMYDAQGQPVGFRSLYHNITLRKQMEADLRTSREQLQDIIQSIQAAVTVHGPDTKIIASNKKAQELLGFSETDLMGMACDDPKWKFCQEDGTPVQSNGYPVSMVIRRKQPVKDLVGGILQRNTNQTVWVLVNAVPKLDGKGDIALVIVTFTDITERKYANDAIREARERMAFALQGADLGMFDFNVQTGRAFVDRHYLAMLGYTHDDFPDISIRTTWTFVHPDDRERVMKTIQNLLNGSEKSADLEYRMHHKSGEWIWVLARGKVVHWDEQGRPLRYTGTHLNITDRKRTEEALRLSEERLRLITDHMTDIVAMTDLHFNILYISPSVYQLTGYQPHERVGKSGVDLVHPDDLPVVRKAIEKALTLYSAGKLEYRIKHANGQYIWLETVGAFMYDQERQIIGIVFNARNITERMKVAEALQRTLDDLESRVRERTFELEEINTTLRVLLRNREEDHQNMQEALQSNINQLVLPFISKLKASELNGQVLEYVNVLENTLNHITSPFISKLSSAYKKLSPRELQIAALIKQGKSSKEISEICNISMGTVNSFRNGIREKLQLIDTDTNLRSYLLSFP